jgi:SOS-response transcriptional repressor LexA
MFNLMSTPCVTRGVYLAENGGMKTEMERLIEAAKLSDLHSQSELARFLGESAQTLTNWAARGISSAGVLKIQDKLSINGSWLKTGEGSMFIENVRAVEAPPGSPLATSPTVPLISWVQAGRIHVVSDHYPVGDAERWLACPVRHSASTFALTVRGDSMYNVAGSPSFADGDVIFVDPEREARHRSLVVVKTANDEATFKRLLVDGYSRKIEALNPSWPMRIQELPSGAIVCGVVIARLESFI